MLQDGLYLLNDFRLGYLLLYHNGRKLLQDLSVLDNLLDEPRLHHTAVVCYGIIEGKNGYRRTLGLIAYTHPWKRRLRPVGILSVLVLMGHADAGWGVSRYRHVQVGIQSEVVYVLYKPLRLVMIVLVDDAADTNIRADEQGLWQIHASIAATTPVMVLHVAPVHVPYAASSLHIFSSIAQPVVKNSHDTCRLEYRAWLQEVTDSMISDFTVFAIEAFLHVYDSLDIARLYVHHHCHANTSVYLLQLIDDSPLGNVLHLDINSGYYVSPVDGFRIRDVQILAPYLTAMDNTISTPENRVIAELQSASCRILCTEHIAHGPLCQRAKRTAARIELLPMESALELRQIEHRQSLHLRESAIVYAVIPYRPVLAHLVISLLKVCLEISG